MITYENQIFTSIATALRTEFPGIYVSGELNLNPEQFPACYIEESDNYVMQSGRTENTAENYSVVTYEVNVFSNKQIGKKQEAKAIMATVDQLMDSWNFTRLALLPVNIDSSTKYRLTARYTAVVDSNETYYRR